MPIRGESKAAPIQEDPDVMEEGGGHNVRAPNTWHSDGVGWYVASQGVWCARRQKATGQGGHPLCIRHLCHFRLKRQRRAEGSERIAECDGTNRVVARDRRQIAGVIWMARNNTKEERKLIIPRENKKIKENT